MLANNVSKVLIARMTIRRHAAAEEDVHVCWGDNHFCHHIELSVHEWRLLSHLFGADGLDCGYCCAILNFIRRVFMQAVTAKVV